MSELEDKIQAGMGIWKVDRVLVERVALIAEQVTNHAREIATLEREQSPEQIHELSPKPIESRLTWDWHEESSVPTAQVINPEGDLVKLVS